MRKVLFVAFVVMAFMAMGALVVSACGGSKATSATGAYSCSATKTTAKLASSVTYSKSSCSIGKRSGSALNNSTIAAKFAAATCSPENMEACMAYAKTKHAEVCKYGSECQMRSMSIKGMTCGACENGIKAAFMNIDGVNKVLEVCYKGGFAIVCANPETASNEVLLKAVSARGFEAEIIPAVATITTDAKTSKINSTGKVCCEGKAVKGDCCKDNSSSSSKSSTIGTN